MMGYKQQSLPHSQFKPSLFCHPMQSRARCEAVMIHMGLLLRSKLLKWHNSPESVLNSHNKSGQGRMTQPHLHNTNTLLEFKQQIKGFMIKAA